MYEYNGNEAGLAGVRYSELRSAGRPHSSASRLITSSYVTSSPRPRRRRSRIVSLTVVVNFDLFVPRGTGGGRIFNSANCSHLVSFTRDMTDKILTCGLFI